MKKIVLVLMTVMLMPTAFAKAPLSDEQQHRIVELDRLENEAYRALQSAEQDALIGKISSNQLRAISNQYEAAKESLQAALSSLPNRGEIEQWLIDNHVRIGE